MKKSIPMVQSFMTTCPHTINADQDLEKAEEMMRVYQIRHLPVLVSGDLIGVITDRDIKFYRDFIAGDAPELKVSDVCQEDVYTVTPSSPLDEVVKGMAEKKLGSAVVIDNGHVVGIFTAIDVMLAMAKLLETRLKAA